MSTKLHFADTDSPGISRWLNRARWAYFDPDGERINDPDEVARLNAIALSPAYTDAWFATDPNAHILATGIDARGRKQYRYHPDFREARDQKKFCSCADFGRCLPRLREKVESELRKKSLTPDRAVASIIRLLDCSRIRVGSESYAKENGSFGASTLRGRHVSLERGRLTLRFRAKSGKWCKIAVSDRGLIRFVKQVQDLPGQHLFQWLDDEGKSHPICSTEVNDFIRDAMNADFTAKDFRTWAASVLAFEFLLENEDGKLRDMLEHVADRLGNTPATARKAYVHPAPIEFAHSGASQDIFGKLPRQTKWLSRAERGLIEFLEKSEGSPSCRRAHIKLTNCLS